jgi:hypothetical protein
MLSATSRGATNRSVAGEWLDCLIREIWGWDVFRHEWRGATRVGKSRAGQELRERRCEGDTWGTHFAWLSSPYRCDTREFVLPRLRSRCCSPEHFRWQVRCGGCRTSIRPSCCAKNNFRARTSEANLHPAQPMVTVRLGWVISAASPG